MARQFSGKRPKDLRFTVESLLSYMGPSQISSGGRGSAGGDQRLCKPVGYLYDPACGQQPCVREICLRWPGASA